MAKKDTSKNQQITAAQEPVEKKTTMAINEESGIGILGFVHAAAGIGGLTAAFNFYASGQTTAAIVFATIGAFMMLNTLFSTWFAQKENHATITTMFGKKKGNITGGGLKFKRPWPWRASHATVPTYVQSVQDTIGNIKTKDGVFIDNMKFQIFYKIVDPGTYVFSADDRIEQMKANVANSLRAKVSNSTAMLNYMAEVASVGDDPANNASLNNALDLYGARQEISETVMTEVNANLIKEYGIEVVNVPIEEPKLDSRFVEAAARRMEKIQDGLARKEFLVSEGEGYAGQREAMLEGYAKTAQKLVTVDKVFPDIETAIKFVEFMIERDTVRDASRNGAVIITDGQSRDGNKEMLAELVAAGTFSGELKKRMEDESGSRRKKAAAPAPKNEM